MAAADLCTVQDVRDFLQKPSIDVSQDAVIGALITAVSKTITSYCEREFAPVVAATARTFELQLFSWPAFLSFAPYDLQTLTSVVMDPDLEAATLSTDEYRLFPVPQKDGVYTSIRLAPLTFPTIGRVSWATRQVKVTGDWGFPSVPADVKQAAVMTTAIWLRRDVSAFSSTFNLNEDRIERPEALPSAVRALLGSYVRMA